MRVVLICARLLLLSFDLWRRVSTQDSDSAVPPYDGTNGAAGHSVVDPTIWCFNIVVREIDLFRKRGRVSTLRYVTLYGVHAYWSFNIRNLL